MSNELSERIAALRKASGLTQEQLGKMVGVSYQAVSKWEKGGAPDVELLPVLSRQLGVTIDALFGMDGGEQVDPVEAVGRWLRGFPAKERLDRFCRLIWQSMEYFVPGEVNLPDMSYPESCKIESDGDCQLFLSQVLHDGGMLLDLHAEDMSFATLWPRPKGGWAQWLAPKDEYRKLFSILAKPGCLELLGYLYIQNKDWFSAGVVHKQLNIPNEDVDDLLNGLVERNILYSMELELESGRVTAYKIVEPIKLIPFLLLGRTLMQHDTNLMRLGDDSPILEPNEVWDDGKKL